ncbi:hypothetical protein AAG587_19985 [Vreelandella neptunia]|uniref:hypothetical protein n=1 Tax=Vreelandella neptunia TaxID=115551 RepID=UPI00315A32B6
MTREDIGDCHSQQLEAVTLSLGKQYRKLVAWAHDDGLLDVLQVIYHALGLSPRNDAIANLVRECSHPESVDILSLWVDDPIVNELQRFTNHFNASPDISRDYSQVPHVGTVDQNKRQFQEGGVKNKTFLITLLTNPLADGKAKSTEGYLLFWRRLLRLWFVVHAAQRIAHQRCIADRNISEVSRFMTLGPYDEKWRVIDALLRRCRSFVGQHEPTLERVNDAFIFAADEVRLDYPDDKSYSRFFNAITAIARQDVNPINHEAIASLLRIDRFLPSAVPLVHQTDEHSEDTEYEFYAYPKEEDADQDPEDEGVYVARVDPSDSDAEQQLASRSYFVQTAEASHFLPWSWEKLLPPERENLLSWVDQCLFSTSEVEQLGAVMVWLSVRFSRTLYFAAQFQIDDDSGDEWTLTTDFSSIARKSPRRGNAWQPNSESLDYVHSIREVLSVELPKQVTAILQRAANAKQASLATLGDMWENTLPLERWFYQQTQLHFPRVTSAKLAQVWGQAVFDNTHDPHLARLLTAHPNAGLPGACSYATWDITAIEKGLSLSLSTSTSFPPSVNLIGSRLSPITTVLRQEIANARAMVEDSADGDLIHYHNVLAQYCVMGLYAASGGRYLKDPFESLGHFNQAARCLYLNDKIDQGRRSSRMVPLPDRAIELLQCYVTHLQWLAQALKSENAVLAGAIHQTLDNKDLPALPLFFLLDDSLVWHSMTNTDVPGVPLFQWPLPGNVFRHRYAQQLRYLKVPAEVVDGWMGHAERSVATYGDFSPLCWTDDAHSYADAVNTAFDELGFCPLTLPSVLPALTPPPSSATDEHYQKALANRRFGQCQREYERRQTMVRERKAAEADIAIYMSRRAWEELTQDDMDVLVQRMLHRSGSVIHTYASLRLSVLLRCLKEEGNRHQHGISKRVAEASAEKSLLSSKASEALLLWPELKRWADNIRAKVLKAHFSKLSALSVGALLLCLEKRISYQRMLLDVARGRNYRLIQHKQEYLLEYSESLELDNYFAPVQRHRISYKTASLLAAGQQIQKEIDLNKVLMPATITPPPDALKGHLPNIAETSVQALFASLGDLMDQVNLLSLPGMVAGMLGGRVLSTSLPLHDELRIREGVRLAFPTHGDSADSELNVSATKTSRWRHLNKVEQQANAQRLYEEVQEVLKGYTKRQFRQGASQIDKLSSAYDGHVSTCVLLLVRWMSFIMRRGKVGKRNDYAQSSLTRYFSALKSAFAEIGYQVDLLDFDEEEITHLYAKMLTFVELTSQDAQYFSHRLRDFHAWVETLGVASPDWQELAIENDRRSVRAGMLIQSEYLLCQSALQSKWQSQHDEKFLLLGFVLLLTFRFGLRAQEAIGLQRNDWCEHYSIRWVLVRDNAQRKLKSDASRRAVPLLFALDPAEEDLIDHVLSRFHSLAGNDSKRPLLGELYASQVKLVHWAAHVSPVLIQLLRNGTTSRGMTLHHCRHAFYNTLAPSLFGIQTPLTESISGHLDPQFIRQQVLGHYSHVSRRSGMAMARLMGHRHPRTGSLNYSHVLTDWADQLTPVLHVRARNIDGVLNTKTLSRIEMPALETTDISVRYTRLNFMVLWKVLRFVGLGMSYERAGAHVNLNPEDTEVIAKIVREAESHMRFKLKGESDAWVSGANHPNILLRQVGEKAWRRLVEHVTGLEESRLVSLDDSVILGELPFLISKNRQLLMSHQHHCSFLIQVFSLFNVPKRYIQVALKNAPEGLVKMLKSNGLYQQKDTNTFQLDPFPIFVDNVLDRRQEYVGIGLKRSPEGTIRNSHELSVAVLACGLFATLKKA